MKHIYLIIISLSAFFAFPSPAISQPAGQNYAEYPVKRVNIQNICFQGVYTWYALGQSGGAVREDTRDGSLRYFSKDDGLPDNTIDTVFTDSNGAVWLGCGRGASRYDGSTFTNYSDNSPLDALETFDIKQDEKGVLWFATWHGVRSFDGTNWNVWTDEIPGGVARLIAIGRSGDKWFGTDQGLVRFDGTAWKTIGPAEGVRSMFVDSKGRVWVLYANEPSSAHLDIITGEAIATAPIKITFFQNPVGAIGEVSDGSIWFGAGREFHVFDGVTWQTVTLAGNLPLSISCAAKALDGSLRFGGDNNEIYLIEKGKVVCSPLETGPVGAPISSAVDSRGIKWFGTYRGLSRFDGTHWKTFYDRDGLAGNYVQAISASGAILWFGTDRGLTRYDGASWKNFGIADGLSDSSIISLASSLDNSNVWTGTSKGVSRYDGKSWKTYTTADGIPENRVNTVFIDNQSGTVYIGTKFGAVKFNGTLWTAATPSPDSITAILVDSSHRQWFGTNRGILRFDGSSWTLFHQSDGVSNLPDNTVTALAEDSSGAIWAGTGLGSVRNDGSKWTVDLKLDKVTAIAADLGGIAWFSRLGYFIGESPVIEFIPTTGTTTGPLQGTWTLMTNQQGAGSFAFAGGSVWTTATRGLARIDPSIGSFRLFTTADGLPYSYSSGVRVASADGRTVWTTANSAGDNKSWIMRWDGNAWSTFITSSGSLDRIAADAKGGVWSVYNAPHIHGTVQRWDVNTGKLTFSASDLQCRVIYITRENTAWLPIYGSNLIYVVPDSLWNSINIKLPYITTPYSGMISAIVENREGVFWCGSTESPFGVGRYDGKSWKTYTLADGLPTNIVNALAADGTGAVWAATPSGAARFDGKQWLTFTPENSGIKSNQVSSVAVAPDGTVWFGGADWVAKFTYDFVTHVEQAVSLPAPLAVGNVSPNPFNSSTLIRFFLPTSGKTRLTVYDITGRKVRELVSGSLPAGDHIIVWNGLDDSGRQVSSGVYFTRLAVGNNAVTRKMLLMK